MIREEDVAPHVPGEWVTVREADYGQEGLRQLLCADCGAVLSEEIIPAKATVQALVLDQSLLNLTYKDSAKIGVEVYPAGADIPILYWNSSDEKVAAVDSNGTVHAVGRGTAVVTCSSADGVTSGECRVTVQYTFRQWLTMIFLFGWIWY